MTKDLRDPRRAVNIQVIDGMVKKKKKDIRPGRS